MTKTIGLIINPIAGIGGAVGLKGSDGEDIQEIALSRGAVRRSAARTAETLKQLMRCRDDVRFLSAPGEMGEDVLAGTDFVYEVTGYTDEKTTAADTERIAAAMKQQGAELLVFAGGDGTARNVFNAVGDTVPVIGIPAGVKIHSGVFATSPGAAGKVLQAFIGASSVPLIEAEVIDLDEEAYRKGRIGDVLYGYMKIPRIASGMQNAKAASHVGDNDIGGICAEIRDRMRAAGSDTVFILGAGSTVYGLKQDLGIDGTLLGIDVVRDGKVMLADAASDDLINVTEKNHCVLIITAIGGQGHIFGRGNQQLTPQVIRNIGFENILIVAAGSKIYSLPDQTLLVDTGDPELDEELRGYRKVITGWQETLICRVR